MTWLWAVWAALAMLGQDWLSTWLVQAESEYLANRAGVLDTLNWPMGMAVTFTTVEALQGHDMALKIAVCAAVSAANYTGTSTAVRIGRRMRDKKPRACACGCPVTAKGTP
jgi:hypothetical protein